MEVNYKDHLNDKVKWMPNGVIHLFLLIILPVYFVYGMFSGGIIEAMKEWRGEFCAKWVFSKDYIKKHKN